MRKGRSAPCGPPLRNACCLAVLMFSSFLSFFPSVVCWHSRQSSQAGRQSLLFISFFLQSFTDYLSAVTPTTTTIISITASFFLCQKSTTRCRWSMDAVPAVLSSAVVDHRDHQHHRHHHHHRRLRCGRLHLWPCSQCSANVRQRRQQQQRRQQRQQQQPVWATDSRRTIRPSRTATAMATRRTLKTSGRVGKWAVAAVTAGIIRTTAQIPTQTTTGIPEDLVTRVSSIQAQLSRPLAVSAGGGSCHQRRSHLRRRRKDSHCHSLSRLTFAELR